MKDKIFKFLFARFIPHRTAVGLVLIVAANLIDALNVQAVCEAAPAVCTFLSKASSVLAPWLVIAGIRDVARK